MIKSLTLFLSGALLLVVLAATKPMQTTYTQNATVLNTVLSSLNDKQDTLVGDTNQFEISGTTINIKAGAPITNLVALSGGTAATPAFQVWDGTGIFKSGEDIIGFTTDGTERWVINASGALNAVGTVDIGNGTADPRYVHAGTSFNIHNQSGIGATIDVLVGGSTTNRLVFVGGILVSNITTFFPE